MTTVPEQKYVSYRSTWTSLSYGWLAAFPGHFLQFYHVVVETRQLCQPEKV